MRQSDLVLEKYWVTHSGYFRLATTSDVRYGDNIGRAHILSCNFKGKFGQESFNKRGQQ